MKTERQKQILIIEDDTLSRITQKCMIGNFSDMNVCGEFDNAEDGIEFLHQNISNVDLVLMDATLPKMNGVEASKVIKNKYPFIKIVILVPYNSDKQVISTLFANADSYYIRDLGQDMLYDVLTQTLADNGSIDKRIQFSVFNYIKRLPEKDYWKILNKLTTEESNFITFVYMGLSRDEISDRLGVSSAQLSNFIYSIFEKLVYVVKFGQFDKELVYDLF